MGIAIASLVYGVSTPDSIHTANKLRKGSSWVSQLGEGVGAVALGEAESAWARRDGMVESAHASPTTHAQTIAKAHPMPATNPLPTLQTFLGVVTILHILANIAAVYVLRWQHSAANADADPQQGGAGSHKLRRSGSLRRMNTTMRLAVRHDHSWVRRGRGMREHGSRHACTAREACTVLPGSPPSRPCHTTPRRCTCCRCCACCCSCPPSSAWWRSTTPSTPPTPTCFTRSRCGRAGGSRGVRWGYTRFAAGGPGVQHAFATSVEPQWLNQRASAIFLLPAGTA